MCWLAGDDGRNESGGVEVVSFQGGDAASQAAPGLVGVRGYLMQLVLSWLVASRLPGLPCMLACDRG